MIKRFQETYGYCAEKIYGQDRYAYAISGTEDFYDMVEWASRGGYQGSVLLFYDYLSGKVSQPFEKKHNVIYGPPIYSDGSFYFLRGDFNEKKITLFKYLPDHLPEPVTEMNTDDVELYNLQLIGEGIHIISQDNQFVCYYPETISFALQPSESVILISEQTVYLERWVEEGWDDENDCETKHYKYYNEIVVKDFEGNTLSEEVGSLNAAPDGNWWIS